MASSELPEDDQVEGDVYEDFDEDFEVFDEDDTWKDFARSPEYRQALRRMSLSFAEPAEFAVGDLVRWKTGLSNKAFPLVDSVGVVVEVSDKPIFMDSDPGTPYFNEPLNIAVASLVGPENMFVVFWYDRRRFEVAE